GQLYGGYLFALPPQALGPRLAALAGYLSEAGPVALTLAGIGLYRGWRIARRAVAWGAVSAGAYAVYALGYTTADSFVFVLPLFLFAGLAAGLGAAEVGRLVSNPARRAMVMAALVAAPVLWGGANAPRLTLRHDAAAETFWRSVLQQAPPGAILLTGDERHTFTLWYARFVLRRRPDVAIIDTRLLAYPWHRADLGRAYPDLTDLDALPGIIQQGRPYRRPLCPVIESEEETRWFVNCLTSKTP
ncbi:MAG: hypothetical protein ACE5G8_09740, partial [Anaerolineae bacterium]